MYSQYKTHKDNNLTLILTLNKDIQGDCYQQKRLEFSSLFYIFLKIL